MAFVVSAFLLNPFAVLSTPSETDQRVQKVLSEIAAHRPTAEIMFFWAAGTIGSKKESIPIGGSAIAEDFKGQLTRLLPLLPEDWHVKFVHDGPTLEKNVWLTELATKHADKLVLSHVAAEEQRLREEFPAHKEIIQHYCWHADKGIASITSDFLRQLPRLVTNSARETHVFAYFDVDTFVDNMSGNNVGEEHVFWKTTLGHGMKAPQRQEGVDKFTPLFFRSHVYVFDIAIEIIPSTEEACKQQRTHHDDLLTYLTTNRQKPLKALRDFWTDLAAGTVDTEKLDKLAALPTFKNQFLVLATKDHMDAKNTHWDPCPFIKTTTTGGWTNADGIGKNMPLGTLFSSSSYVSSCFFGDTWNPNHKARPKGQDHEKKIVEELAKVFNENPCPSGEHITNLIGLQRVFIGNKAVEAQMVQHAKSSSFLKKPDGKRLLELTHQLWQQSTPHKASDHTMILDLLLGSLRTSIASGSAISAPFLKDICTILLQDESPEEAVQFQHALADQMKKVPEGTPALPHLAQCLLPHLDAKLECLKKHDEEAHQAEKTSRQATPLSVWLTEHKDGLSARRLIDAEADRLYTLEHGSLPQCDWKKPYADYRKSEDERRAPFFQEILQLHGWADDQPAEGAAALSQ